MEARLEISGVNTTVSPTEEISVLGSSELKTVGSTVIVLLVFVLFAVYVKNVVIAEFPYAVDIDCTEYKEL